MSWQQYHDRKKKSKALFGGRRSRKNLIVREGDTRKVRFYPDIYTFYAHFLPDVKSDKMETCRRTIEQPCILCDNAVGGYTDKEKEANKNKRREEGITLIYPAWLRVSMRLFDYTRYHLVPVAGKENERGRFEICTMADAGNCEWCDKGIKQNYMGQRIITFSGKEADQIEQFDLSSMKRCANCGKGRISVVGYKCVRPIGSDDDDICGENLSFLSEERAKEMVMCPGCKNPTAPFPLVECSQCDDPDPQRFWMCDCDITREKKNNWKFVWDVVEDPIPEYLKVEEKPIVLSEHFAPKENDILRSIIMSGGSQDRMQYDKNSGDNSGLSDIPF